MSPTVSIDLSTSALRHALDLVDAGAHESLDELVESLIAGRSAQANGPTQVGKRFAADHPLTERPLETPTLPLAEQQNPPVGQLQFLTNRLNPIKLTCRVIANLADPNRWPEVSTVQRVAADVARGVGTRLRKEDERAGRRARARRWVAYPVGADARAALERFIFSFTVDRPPHGGALSLLGLAEVRGNEVVLTNDGWALAYAESPLLDGMGGGTLSQAEVDILRKQIQSLPQERVAIREFLGAVRRSGGSQPRIDGLLAIIHKDWSADRTAAERAAMVARLGELQVVQVSGRGQTATVEILDSAALEE
jgi:hypothetical protein